MTIEALVFCTTLMGPNTLPEEDKKDLEHYLVSRFKCMVGDTLNVDHSISRSAGGIAPEQPQVLCLWISQVAILSTSISRLYPGLK